MSTVNLETKINELLETIDKISLNHIEATYTSSALDIRLIASLEYAQGAKYILNLLKDIIHGKD